MWYSYLATSTRSPLFQSVGLRLANSTPKFWQHVTRGTTRVPPRAAAVTGNLQSHTGHCTLTWSPHKVLAIDPVGMTNASATNSLSIRTRTTTNTTVSNTSRVGSPCPLCFLSRPPMTIRKTLGERVVKGSCHVQFRGGFRLGLSYEARSALEGRAVSAQPSDATPVNGLDVHPAAADGPVRRPARLMEQEWLPKEVSLGDARDLPRPAVVRIGRVVPEHEVLVAPELVGGVG